MAAASLQIFDTHAHLTDSRFAPDLAEVTQRWEETGIVGVLCAGDNLASSRQSLALAQGREDIYAAVGIHPENVQDFAPGDIELLRELAQQPKVAAIGEIGLDYYWDQSTTGLQQIVFRFQLQLALELGLPVLVHDREAHLDTMATLREFSGLPRVVLHCFSGNQEMAAECVRLGFYLGVGGTLTYRKNEALRQIIKDLPLEQILLETDCPYLAPQQRRGERNEPSFLPEVVAQVAELKGISPERAAQATTANARRCFRLK